MFGSPLSIGFLPTWLTHAASNRFLNTDTWLHDAERFARRGGGKLKYKAPTTSDMGPTVFRQWWEKQGMAAVRVCEERSDELRRLKTRSYTFVQLLLCESIRSSLSAVLTS